MDKPWRRAFTYGDAGQAEWLAEIYLDIDLVNTRYGRQDDFRRVLTGAPLWVRTPHPKAITLYTADNSFDVVADRQFRTRRAALLGEQVPRWAFLNRNSERTVTAVTAYEESRSKRDFWPGPNTTLPDTVYETLKAGFIKSAAEWAIGEIKDRPVGNRTPHLGDSFGRVFAWVWDSDEGQAMMMLAEYLVGLRGSYLSMAQVHPPIFLDEVLRGLEPALPFGFDDYDKVADMARDELRRYRRQDPIT